MLIRVALLAIAVSLLAASGAQARTPCATLGTTVAKNKVARVYQVRDPHGSIKELRTYGCWLANGHRLRLDQRCNQDDLSPEGDDACRDDPSSVVLRRQHVALVFGGFYNGEGGETFTLIVRGNLRNARRDEVVQIDNDSSFETSPFVIRMFVSKRGGIAYSADNVNDGGEVDFAQIGRVAPPRRGKPPSDTVLDRGTEVEPKTLRAHPKRITWISGGLKHSAPWR